MGIRPRDRRPVICTKGETIELVRWVPSGDGWKHCLIRGTLTRYDSKSWTLDHGDGFKARYMRHDWQQAIA